MSVSSGEISIPTNTLTGDIMKTRTVVLTLIVALMSLTVLSGCSPANKDDYNNNTNLFWGLINRTSSGGSGTDDAPALSDRTPNTHIDQKGGDSGSSGRGGSRKKKAHKDRVL